MAQSVKILDGSLHESPERGGTLILRGVIDPDSLQHLKVDDYQREALPLASLRRLSQALKEGNPLPDIEVGMRGERVRSAEDNRHWFLQDECYIIDGQQRVNACMNAMKLSPGLAVNLGAAIHFNTSKEWERERFRVLNANRVKVSPNVLLRNLRDDHPAVDKIWELTNLTEGSFSLGGRVCWSQNMKRGQLVTALNVLKAVSRLHNHLRSAHATRIDELATNLDELADKITLSIFRDNATTFFNTIDEVWGIRNVQYRELSAHLSGAFMGMVARVFSNHLDFWRNVKLFVPSEIKDKMSKFCLSDPGIAPLTSSVGASQNILYGLFMDHINSGKRTKRLRPRNSEPATQPSQNQA